MRGIGLFYELAYFMNSLPNFGAHLDIAISGLRTRRVYAIGGKPTIFDLRQQRLRRGVEGVDISNDMVAWHDEHDRAWRIKGKGRKSDCRRSIAGAWFQQNDRIINPDGRQLRGHNIGMRGIGNDHWCCKPVPVHHPQNRKLKHGMRIGKRQKLLRSLGRRQRPQARSAAAR